MVITTTFGRIVDRGRMAKWLCLFVWLTAGFFGRQAASGFVGHQDGEIPRIRGHHYSFSYQLPSSTSKVYYNFSSNRDARRSQGCTLLLAWTDNEKEESSTDDATSLPKYETQETPVRFFLDISVQDEPLGRLVFVLPRPKSLLPLHTDNLLQLIDQSRRSIDPACHYIGTEFQYSPQFIEGLAQYRWAHVLAGRGRNAVGRPTERIVDTTALQENTHRLYGGIYYGLSYDELVNEILPEQYSKEPNAAYTAVLTLPLTGPGRGSTTLSIVRVAESPPEWRQRLLLNAALVGWVEPASMPVLQAMARQRMGPPTVTNSGILSK